jgi:3-methyladenine DNA glycosylase AlkD
VSPPPRSAECAARSLRDTDLELLYACLEPSLGSKEFFLQKAIGWALRQYAWTDEREIVRYVRANRERLAALTRREALKDFAAR